FSGVVQRDLLRRGHDDGAGQGDQFGDAELGVSRARGEVHHQIVQIAPDHVPQELLDGGVDHRTTPRQRLVIWNEEPHRDQLDAVTLRRQQLAVLLLRRPFHAHHHRDVGAVHVGIHESDLRALQGETGGQGWVASTTVNLTVPSSIFRSLTMLRVMRSLCNSGSITMRSASMTACSVTLDISYNFLGNSYWAASAHTYAEFPGTRAVLFLHARSVVSLLERRISSGPGPTEALDVTRDCWHSRVQGSLRIAGSASL